MKLNTIYAKKSLVDQAVERKCVDTRFKAHAEETDSSVGRKVLKEDMGAEPHGAVVS